MSYWSIHKKKSFDLHWYDYKHFLATYWDDMTAADKEEIKAGLKRVPSQRAPFERHTDDVAEFDMAIHDCGDYYIYIMHYICNLSLEYLAYMERSTVKAIDIRAGQANEKVIKCLFSFNNKEAREKYLAKRRAS